MLTTSPVTASPICGPTPGRPTIASPVFKPKRTATRTSGLDSASWCTASRMFSATRRARSGSSSCATGAPNTDRAVAPMNLSTVPP